LSNHFFRHFAEYNYFFGAPFFAAQKNRAFRSNSSACLRQACGIPLALTCRRQVSAIQSIPIGTKPEGLYFRCNPGRMGEQQFCLQNCDQPLARPTGF
jgi:hypothetical protein